MTDRCESIALRLNPGQTVSSWYSAERQQANPWDFHAAEYTQYLLSLGLGVSEVSRLSVDFMHRSPLLQQQIDDRKPIDRIYTGGYQRDRQGNHLITVFLSDCEREAQHTGRQLTYVVNEVLGDESGHLYAAVHGLFVRQLAVRRLYNKLGHVGAAMRGEKMERVGTALESMSTRLLAAPHVTADEEAFADSFRKEYAMPDFAY